MRVLIPIILLIAGGLLNIIKKPGKNYAHILSKTFIYLMLIIGISYWILIFPQIKNPELIKVLTSIQQYTGLLGYLMLGYLMTYIGLSLKLKSTYDENNHLKEIISSTLAGSSIFTGNIFIIATVGKIENFKGMSDFFTVSGYAIWFLYFIMCAEAFGGLGIWLHFKLKTGPFAAIGLILVMIGAVYTHWHNKDPFSDSYAAIAQLVNLILLLCIYQFEQWHKINRLN